MSQFIPSDTTLESVYPVAHWPSVLSNSAAIVHQKPQLAIFASSNGVSH